MKVGRKLKLLKSVKRINESAGGHATQRRRACDGAVRMKNEMNKTHHCLSSCRGVYALAVRGVVVRAASMQRKASGARAR